MKTSAEEFSGWLKKPEGLNLEFKAVSSREFSMSKLYAYCAAISNSGGGKLLMGVDDNGRVVGTKYAEGTYSQLSHQILQKLSIRVDVEEYLHQDGRIIIFHIPPHPHGVIVTFDRQMLERVGESLVAMDMQTIKNIVNETQPDFSAGIVSGLDMTGLNKDAISKLREKWAQHSRRTDYEKLTDEQVLHALGLMTDKGLNYACLLLLGKEERLREILLDSEIIFEWRRTKEQIHHDFRAMWVGPFILMEEDIWKTINSRNLRIPFQEGFIQREIFAFSEKPIREAVLNAVAHRDYSIKGQAIFIKSSSEEFCIESPGGFMPGISPENILEKYAWRNRRVMEVFEKAGLVERSGQGMDDIFYATIKEGKGLPDLSMSDNHRVVLKIPAAVKDEKFILFLERIANEKQLSFSPQELYELEKIHERQKIPKMHFKEHFLKLGIIEKIGQKKGTQYILSSKYYEFIGKSGLHTRMAGLKREEKKMLILKHIKKREKTISSELQEALNMDQVGVKNLLKDLKKENKVRHIGAKKTGYWVLFDKS